MNPSNRNNKKIAAIVGLLVIVAAVGAGLVVSADKKSSEAAASLTPTPSPQSPAVVASTPAVASAKTPAQTPAQAPVQTSPYKDGSYSAIGSYESPDGNESINISITLKGGVVTATTATQGTRDPTSARYQSQFIAGYKSLVVGRSIDAIRLSRVSGSSLTSGGFNDALQQIKSQAKG